MAKKLSDNLRPASFRGLAFFVEDAGFAAGRRVQVHEYPQRDKPYVEDLGRATRELDFTGFLVGEDYIEQANKFIGALEKEGAGQLVHPWLGTLKVSLKDLGRVNFNQTLGRASIALSFVESGELEYPAAGTSTQAASRIAASNLQTASLASFVQSYGVKGFQDFVSSAAAGQLGDVLNVVSSSEVGKVLGAANDLGRAASTVIGYVSTPSALGIKMLGVFGLSGLATTAAAWSSIVRSLSRVTGLGSLGKPSSSSGTASRRQATANTTAINAITRQALLVQAVGASSLVGTTADVPSAGLLLGTAVETTVPKVSHQEMIAVRNELLAAIDAETLLAGDDVYTALLAARNAVWSDLTARANDNARLATIAPPEVLPALVIAYDYYEDAGRDQEIISRNRIRHPGFVPANPLKVLTR